MEHGSDQMHLSAAAHQEKHKISRYPDGSMSDDLLFIPLVFETFGSWGALAQKFFRRLITERITSIPSTPHPTPPLSHSPTHPDPEDPDRIRWDAIHVRATPATFYRDPTARRYAHRISLAIMQGNARVEAFHLHSCFRRPVASLWPAHPLAPI